MLAASLLLGSATVFYVSPWPLLYAPALVAVAILTWWRLDLALILVPFFVPYFMVPKHLGHFEFAPSEIFLGIDVLVAALYVAVPDRRSLLRWHHLVSSPFLIPGVLFLLAGAVSTVVAVQRHEALRYYREWILEPAAFFALLLLVADRLSRWWWLFGSLIASAIVVSFIGLGQYVSGHGLNQVPGTSIRHVEALYGSPDNLGLLYDRVIPIWFAIGLLGRLGFPWRLLWWCLAPLFGVVLLLSGSRGAWVAVAAACLFSLVMTVSWGRWFAIAVVLGAIAVGLLAGPKVAHALRYGHANTVQRRIDLWRSSVRMVRDHPVVGIGPDNFIHYYAPRPGPASARWIKCSHGLGYMLPAAWQEPCLSHPHNELLDFWLNTGLAGLISAIWLQAVFWISALTLWFRTGVGRRSGLLLGAMAAMLASLIHGLVDNSYFLIDLAIIFWMLCAFVSYMRSTEDDAEGAANLRTGHGA